jgi:hypothetical protein
MFSPGIVITRFENTDRRRGDVRLYFRPMARTSRQMRLALLAAGDADRRKRGCQIVDVYWCRGPKNGRELLRFQRAQRPLSTRPKYHKRFLTGW